MLELALVKTHLRVDHDLDDALIHMYMQAALQRVEAHLNRKIIANEADRTLETDLLNNSVVDLSVLKLVGHFYAQREVVLGNAVHILNELYELLQPFRIIYGD